jgi:Ca2+-binding RTX toxin-like protein
MNKLSIKYPIGLIILILSAVLTAVTATNIVPESNLDDQQSVIKANDLKPTECSSLNLNNVISGSGTILGDNQNNLILGSSANDNIDARQGDDCIVGGDGDDQIDGRNGYDICIGGGGHDTYFRCEEIID